MHSTSFVNGLDLAPVHWLALFFYVPNSTNSKTKGSMFTCLAKNVFLSDTRTVHKSHDPWFHVFLMKQWVTTFVTHRTVHKPCFMVQPGCS